MINGVIGFIVAFVVICGLSTAFFSFKLGGDDV